MKKFKLILLMFFSVFVVTFTSCGLSNNDDENGVVIEKKKTISFNSLIFWNSEEGDYDSKTKTISFNKQWTGAFFDFKDTEIKGKYLIVKYENISGEMCATVTYSDETDETVPLDSVKSRAYILLNQNKTLKRFTFQQRSDEASSLKISQLGFTDTLTLEKDPVVDSASESDFDDSISAVDFVKNMGVGFNLANYFDSRVCYNDSLTVRCEWGQPETTEEMIQQLKDTGAKTIRIPVTWCGHIVGDDYTIDPYWMEEVKKVVDWAYNAGLYVIINEHHSVHDDMNTPIIYHEGYILRNTDEDIAESERFLKAIWEQISEAFNNSYDEHLIFETMNEPRNTGHEHAWQPGLKLDWCDNSACAECIKDHQLNNEYNKLILDTIRASGGNNAKRFVMIPSMCGSYDAAVTPYFKMPKDSAKDKLILTYHHYPLYNQLWSQNSTYYENLISDQYKNINEEYVKKGVPVVVGEIGPSATEDVIEAAGLKLTENEALLTCSYIAETTAKYGISVIIWPRQYTWENLTFAKKIVNVWNENKQ